MRVAVLWTRLSGYFAACLGALAKRGATLLTVHYPVASNAPFDVERLGVPGTKCVRGEFRTWREIKGRVEAFGAGVVLVSGWMDHGYLRTALALRHRGLLVIGAMDNQWRATLRQRVGQIPGRWFLQAAFSVLWVPGERAAQFARRLGFSGPRLWTGLYCGATCSLRAAETLRWEHVRRLGTWPRRFVFVGRYEEVKGVPELLAAYRLYRERVQSPWELVCVGHGKLKTLVARAEGVRDLGFVQPWDLPAVLAECGCFVLPSRREGWVVALLEAAATGLPIVCSDQCGSHVELVQEGVNGWVIPSGDVDALASALETVSRMPLEELWQSGKASAKLAAAYTPERWADQFMTGYHALVGNEQYGVLLDE